jgi:ribose transport system ATP-binding protein
MLNKELVLELRNIDKKYPGVHALKGVDFELRKGEIKGLLGKNGAGKSTIVKIIAGLEKKTEGEISFFGEKKEPTSVQDSESFGFRFVSQDPILMNDLNVAENIAFREKAHKRYFGLVNWEKIYQQAEEKMAEGGFKLDPKLDVKYLTVSEKQMLLFLREVLSTQALIIALDEVTTALSSDERSILYKVIRREAKNGKSFIYISHELNEIFEVCDTVSVLRDGEIHLDGEVKNLTMDDLQKAIVGMDIVKMKSFKSSRRGQDKSLIVKNISNQKIDNISFDLYKGEILGLYGLRSSGRTELLETIFGLLPVEKGQIICGDERVENFSISKRNLKGIGFVPEDREKGIFFNLPVVDNVLMSAWRWVLGKLGLFIDEIKKIRMFQDIAESVNLSTPSPDTEILYLSGGNKQKAMVGRCVASNSRIYLFDEVTKGIDIGAKVEVYKIMKGIASKGNSIIFTSSEIEEILDLSDRVIVLRDGRIVGIIPQKDFSEKKIIRYADGLSS